MHLEDYAEHIQEGDWVEAGEIIAYVGNTGNAKIHHHICIMGSISVEKVRPILILI